MTNAAMVMPNGANAVRCRQAHRLTAASTISPSGSSGPRMTSWNGSLPLRLRMARRARRIWRRYGSRAIRAPGITGYFVAEIGEGIGFPVMVCAECGADCGLQIGRSHALLAERV